MSTKDQIELCGHLVNNRTTTLVVHHLSTFQEIPVQLDIQITQDIEVTHKIMTTT